MHEIGSDLLMIHLEKNCSACIKDLKEMLSNEGSKGFETALEPQGEAGQGSNIQEAEGPAQDLITGEQETLEAILEPAQVTPELPTKEFQKVLEILSFQPFYRSLLVLTEEFKKDRRLKLFNTRTFFCRDLVTTNNDGTKNYENLIEHIKFLEEIIKDLKSCYQAADLARVEMLNSATAAERQAITESDKKYAPKFKEREKAETEKMTAQEKQIRKFISMGLTREAAEKIIFAR